MTSTQDRPRRELANVLRDQTAPNTLGGIGPPMRAARRPISVRVPMVVVAVVVAVLLALLSRAA